MSAWGAAVANICCTTIPLVWHPGMKVLVRWDMPEGPKHIFKEKIVDVERYDEPGSLYIHIFPDDEVRVVVSNIVAFSKNHPIAPPRNPAKKQ